MFFFLQLQPGSGPESSPTYLQFNRAPVRIKSADAIFLHNSRLLRTSSIKSDQSWTWWQTDERREKWQFSQSLLCCVWQQKFKLKPNVVEMPSCLTRTVQEQFYLVSVTRSFSIWNIYTAKLLILSLVSDVLMIICLEISGKNLIRNFMKSWSFPWNTEKAAPRFVLFHIWARRRTSTFSLCWVFIKQI